MIGHPVFLFANPYQKKKKEYKAAAQPTSFRKRKKHPIMNSQEILFPDLVFSCQG